MKRFAVALLAGLLITGFAAAAHNSGTHAGDSGSGAVSDTPTAGKTAGPENTGKPEDVGKDGESKGRMKGIQKAITKIPGDVAEAVLTPIQNFDPGKTLGNALSGLGEMLRIQARNTTQAMNDSANFSK